MGKAMTSNAFSHKCRSHNDREVHSLKMKSIFPGNFGRSLIFFTGHRTLQGEGHSAAWLGHKWTCQDADTGPKSIISGNRQPPLAAHASQYATSNGKLLLFWFPRKWCYINLL